MAKCSATLGAGASKLVSREVQFRQRSCRYTSRPHARPSLPTLRGPGRRRPTACAVAPRHQEAFVKGLGWPQDLRAGAAAGLGWPGSSGASIAPGLWGSPITLPEGSTPSVAPRPAVPVVAAPATVAPQAPERVVVVLRQDSRHVIGASLAPSRHMAPANAGRPSPGSAMLGWDGAAPAVTRDGLSWPTVAPVSHETEAVGSPIVRPRTPENEQIARRRTHPRAPRAPRPSPAIRPTRGRRPRTPRGRSTATTRRVTRTATVNPTTRTFPFPVKPRRTRPAKRTHPSPPQPARATRPQTTARCPRLCPRQCRLLL